MSGHKHHDKGKILNKDTPVRNRAGKGLSKNNVARQPVSLSQGNHGMTASKPAAINSRLAVPPDNSSATPVLTPSSLVPALYVVATPIGNAADITLRALSVLREVDVIACEDSRVTAKLLARHDIRTKLMPYHEHNAARMRPRILTRLASGERIALVSDAGTPLVSDPGYKLVRDCIAANISVVPLPGPSAPLAALVLSGLPSDRFLFAGFLPSKALARRKSLMELAQVPATLLFFESAQRLPESLADMADVLGDRPAAVAREITKLFEECRRGSLRELAAHYQDAGPPKGEVVVICGGATEARQTELGESLDRQLQAALGHLSLKDAVAAVASATGQPRKQVYARALGLTAATVPGDDE